MKTYRHAAARRMSRNDQRILDQISRRALMAAIMWCAFGYEEETLPRRNARPARQEAQP